ncbi:hypothetical protein IQ260_16195 [Leptolyngbya cf. ectocarpi LEGE 11479]|uniref:Uncharacterized protein n=1 Tax=Leptolyngbya cf. ectocarpi LEGE 11479 TaxID=1828722 RepID=A0A928ZVF3_LEPEC|nr:hypothetical protein [Leptolyngbya ectocarpi]MBE9068194.1 hypothetical protein [Leptolyngbya cf. ectocarpi LEGE 11479]
MKLSALEQRIKDLDKNISENYELLKEFEHSLLYTNDPREKVKFKQEIVKIKESASNHQQEYEALLERLNRKTDLDQDKPSSQLLNDHLNEIAERLEVLLDGQRVLRSDHLKTSQLLLNHYKANEKRIIASITEKLDQQQTTLVRLLLEGIDANQLSTSEMAALLAELRQHIATLPGDDTKVILGIIDSPETSFSHRLKVAIPLIPQLLPFFPAVEYEGEVELGTGFDVKAFWERVKTKLRGK